MAWFLDFTEGQSRRSLPDRARLMKSGPLEGSIYRKMTFALEISDFNRVEAHHWGSVHEKAINARAANIKLFP